MEATSTVQTLAPFTAAGNHAITGLPVIFFRQGTVSGKIQITQFGPFKLY